MCACWNAQRCRFALWDSRKTQRNELRPPVENASLWISWPFVPPRAPIPFCCVDPSHVKLWLTLVTVPRSTTPTLTQTSSPMSVPRDASSNGLVVVVALVVSRSNRWTLPLGVINKPIIVLWKVAVVRWMWRIGRG